MRPLLVQRRFVFASPLLAILVMLATSGGCNVIQYQRGRIRGRLTDAGLHEKQVRLGEDTISYWEGGTGDPVVLLHGMGMAALWQWNEQAPELARTHHVVMPDLLWFGGSSSSRRDFSLGHQIAAVRALIEHLGLSHVDLVGLSYGGLVAYGVATASETARPHRDGSIAGGLEPFRVPDKAASETARPRRDGSIAGGLEPFQGSRQGDPTRIRSLVLVDSPGPAFGKGDYVELTARLGTEDPTEIFIPQTAKAVHHLMALAYEHPPYIPDFAARQLIAEAYTANRNELHALFTASSEHIDALTSAPPHVTQPLCLIWGRNDPVFPLAFTQRLLPFAAGRTATHIIEDARHAPNVEHPQQFNASLQACLAFVVRPQGDTAPK